MSLLWDQASVQQVQYLLNTEEIHSFILAPDNINMTGAKI